MGQIVELSSENFASEVLNSDKPVFVDFWAPWCGPCKSLAPTIVRLADAYSGLVKFAKVNTDVFEESKEQYGIRSIPTVMVFEGGEISHRQSGAQPYGHYKEVLDSILGTNVAPEVAAEAKIMGDYADLLMGKGSVDELGRFLSANPELANTPLEIQGSTVLPMRLLLFRRDVDRTEVLLKAKPKLTHFEFAGLGRVEDLKRAIDADKDIVNQPDEGGATALAYAAISRQLDAVKVLLKAGADPNHREAGEGQGSPVDAAIMGGSVEVIDLLVKHGGKLPPTSPYGLPTLHFAAIVGEIELVRCLIDNGLDPSVTNQRDQTAANVARNMKHEEIAGYIESEIAKRG